MSTEARSRVEISIVLPCLNEAASIDSCVRDAWKGLERLGVIGEIIVADNGSHDDSQLIATHAGARVELATARGYGAALRHGIAAALGEYIIIADADGSYDLTNLSTIWQRLQAGDDLVIGNRFRGHIAPGAMPILNRYLGNPLLSAVGRALTRTTLGDFHCGIRGFRTTAITALELRTNGMEYASEMIARAAAQNLRISETPVDLRKDNRGRSGSHLRPLRDGLRHIKTLLAHRRRSSAAATISLPRTTTAREQITLPAQLIQSKPGQLS